jgi:hypothetical protein
MPSLAEMIAKLISQGFAIQFNPHPGLKDSIAVFVIEVKGGQFWKRTDDRTLEITETPRHITRYVNIKFRNEVEPALQVYLKEIATELGVEL